MANKITCQKCRRTKDEIMFYTYKDGRKTQLCKECLLMHVNIWQPDTFLWLLQKMDVPYIEEEWNVLRDKAYAKNPKKKNDTTVFGKYLSKMKLKQWKQYGWADTEKLAEERRKQKQAELEVVRVNQEMYQEQYEKGQISQAEYRTLVDVSQQRESDIQKPRPADDQDLVGADNAYNEKNFMAEQDIPDLAKDLTEDDKKYLVMKWGRLYSPQEWVQLQTFYNEMINSFDIQDADTRSTLILICKNNLKMNQAIDQGDLEGYQKLARVSDQLRKSAKFTAAQNKEEKSQFVDSVGQLVAYCQKHGGQIPSFELKTEKDIVDSVINDLKAYNKSLIYEDTALARQIEDYLKKREYIEENKKDLEEAKAKGLGNVELSDQDIQKYNNQIERQKVLDSKLLQTEEGDNQ